MILSPSFNFWNFRYELHEAEGFYYTTFSYLNFQNRPPSGGSDSRCLFAERMTVTCILFMPIRTRMAKMSTRALFKKEFESRQRLPYNKCIL